MAVRIAAARPRRLPPASALSASLGLQVRRHVEELGPELILRLAGVDPDVISALREHAGRELVGSLSRRPLALEALGVDSAGVLDELTVLLR